MESLLSLPVDLLKGRLFCFLSIVDVTRLDEAVQNHDIRPNFIEALTSTTFAKEQDVLGGRDKLFWLWKRYVKCSSLELGFDVDDRYLCDHLEAVEKVEHLTLRSCTLGCGLQVLGIYCKMQDLTTIELYNCTDICEKGHEMLKLKELRCINCRGLDDDTFRQIVENFPNLEVVEISGCVSLTDSAVETIAAFCPELREFYCKDMALETFIRGSLSLIADCCPKFEKLVCDSLELIDEQLVSFAEHCPDLRCLELGECQGLSDETVIEIAKQSEHLETFAVDFCDISDVAVIALLHYCGDTLTTFSIDSASAITDDSLTAIATQCNALTSLHLGNFPECSTEALLEIVSSCSALYSLELPGCDMMTDAVLHNISTTCVQLTTIDISEVSGFTDEALIMLFKSCVKLECVSMNHMVVKDCVLQQLGESCVKLHTLNLTSSVITTNGLVALSAHCTTLTTLRISDTFVDDVGIVSILSRNANMIELNICGCNVGDGSMQMLSTHCRRLRKLFMDRCPLVSDVGFFAVASNCRQLREVWVNEGKFVDDKTIAALVENCRYLEVLRVHRCSKLTPAILPIMQEHCHYLRRVEFDECRKSFKLTSAKFKVFALAFHKQAVIVDSAGEEALYDSR